MIGACLPHVVSARSIVVLAASYVPPPSTIDYLPAPVRRHVSAASTRNAYVSPRVEANDRLRVEPQIRLRTVREPQHAPRRLLACEPVGHRPAARQLLSHRRHARSGLVQHERLAGPHQIGWDVDPAATDAHMSLVHELPCHRPRARIRARRRRCLAAAPTNAAGSRSFPPAVVPLPSQSAGTVPPVRRTAPSPSASRAAARRRSSAAAGRAEYRRAAQPASAAARRRPCRRYRSRSAARPCDATRVVSP